MRAVGWKSRALATAVVFAVAGFCLAVNTPYYNEAPGVAVRGVGTGTPLRFTNPPVATAPAEFDLGDAAFGSTITRYITAEGGLKPYRFTSVGPQSLISVLEGFHSTLQLGISGVLAGSLPGRPTKTDPVTKVVTPLPFPSTTVTGVEGFRFQVTVQDAKGSNATGTVSGMYNLNLVDSLVFRFAMDKLSDARLGASYLAKVDVVGGRGAINFSAMPVAAPVATNTVTGATVPLKDLGLFVTLDGTVVGRPLMVGSYAISMQCKDSRNQTALARNLSGPNQVFTIVVRDEPVTSSDLVTVQCDIRGSYILEGHDVLRYKGILNVLGMDTFQFVNSDFSCVIAGITLAGRLNAKGQYNAVLDDTSNVQFKINAKTGQVDISIKRGSFATAVGANSLKAGLTRRPVQVTVGDAVACSEVLDFDTRTGTTGYSLDYRLGRSGSNAGGAFQIVNVKGKDDVTFSGQTGDAWRVGFLAVPRLGVQDPAGRKQGFDNVTGATVRIGVGFVDPLAGARLRVSKGSITAGGTIAGGVKRLTLSKQSFFGRIQTRTISTKSTGIPQASASPAFGTVFFPLGLDLQCSAGNAPFSGEHARRIFGLMNQYKDVPPKR